MVGTQKLHGYTDILNEIKKETGNIEAIKNDVTGLKIGVGRLEQIIKGNGSQGLCETVARNTDRLSSIESFIQGNRATKKNWLYMAPLILAAFYFLIDKFLDIVKFLK